jgi:vitamin B12 transporter
MGFVFSGPASRTRWTESGCATRRIVPLLVSALLAMSSSLGAQVPGEVRGRISDAESGQAIAGANIEVVARAIRVTANVGGAFVLRGLEPGEHNIRIRALGHAERDTTVAIENGRTTTLDVTLLPIVSRLDAIVVRATRDSTSALTFGRQAIEQSGRRDLGELLESVPGVVVTRAGGPGSESHISIRGSGANEVLVLVNGVPINSAISGDADLSTIALETVERVRVLPGAQSARYGGRALAGVVLIETRRAERDVSGAASMGAWGERSASGSIGESRPWNERLLAGSVTADYRDVRGDFSYDVPNVRGGGTARRINADARSIGVVGSASIDGPGDSTGSVQVHTAWQSRDRGMPGSIVQPSTTGRQQDTRFAGGIDARRSVGRIQWTGAADGARERVVIADPAPPFGSIYNDVVNASSLIATTSATAHYATTSVAAGSEARALGVTSTMLAPGAPRRQQQVGGWLTVRALDSIVASTELAADLSARGDWDSLLRGIALSPRAAVTATRHSGSLSASVGGGYAPPTLADQFFHEGVLVRPNANLRPERVRHELELRAALRDVRFGFADVSGDVAAFRADIDGMILWLPDFRFVWSPSNFDVRRSGWETNGRVSIPSIGADVRASMNRADVSYTGPVLGGQVAYRPRSTANIAVGVSRWARIEVITRYIGARRTVPGSDLNLLDPYWLSDVMFARPFQAGAWQFDASVAVENIFDRSAAMLVDYPFPGRAWTLAIGAHRR